MSSVFMVQAYILAAVRSLVNTTQKSLRAIAGYPRLIVPTNVNFFQLRLFITPTLYNRAM